MFIWERPFFKEVTSFGGRFTWDHSHSSKSYRSEMLSELEHRLPGPVVSLLPPKRERERGREARREKEKKRCVDGEKIACQ